MSDPYELLREVLASGRAFDDPRVRYVEVQLTRDLLEDIAKAIEEREHAGWMTIRRDILNHMAERVRSGHGHVLPRTDQTTARCLGLPHCDECRHDEHVKALVKVVIEMDKRKGGGA